MSDDLLKLGELEASNRIAASADEAFERAQVAFVRGDMLAFDTAVAQHKALAAQHQKLTTRATLQ